MTADINKNLAILGLRPGAKQIEIKNAFQNLTLIYHPDISETDTTEKYREILEAYEALYDKDLYKKELEDLKKDPEAYYQAKAKFPMAFEEDSGRTSGKNTTNTSNTTSNKPVPTYYTRNQKKPKTTTKTTPSKKNDNSSDIVPFCIGGAVVAILIALLSFPPVILIIIIALVAYWLLK